MNQATTTITDVSTNIFLDFFHTSVVGSMVVVSFVN